MFRCPHCAFISTSHRDHFQHTRRCGPQNTSSTAASISQLFHAIPGTSTIPLPSPTHKRFRTTPVITPILMIPKPLLISVWHHPPMFQHQTDLKTKVKVMTPKSKKSTSTLTTTTLIQTMNPTHRVRIRIHFDGFKNISVVRLMK